MLDYQRGGVTVFAVPNRYKTCGEHPKTTAEEFTGVFFVSDRNHIGRFVIGDFNPQKSQLAILVMLTLHFALHKYMSIRIGINMPILGAMENRTLRTFRVHQKWQPGKIH